jgi:hypothetical protein
VKTCEDLHQHVKRHPNVPKDVNASLDMFLRENNASFQLPVHAIMAVMHTLKGKKSKVIVMNGKYYSTHYLVFHTKYIEKLLR